MQIGCMLMMMMVHGDQLKCVEYIMHHGQHAFSMQLESHICICSSSSKLNAIYYWDERPSKRKQLVADCSIDNNTSKQHTLIFKQRQTDSVQLWL